MNLYEIDSAILNCVDVETGEIFDADMFDTLKIERDAKIENIALWIKNLKAEAEALKAEKLEFAKRQREAENKMESLKNYLATYLDGNKFESTRCKVTFRKSESLVIEDGAFIPDAFLVYKEPDIDKNEIKRAIKQDGLQLDGVYLDTKQNIQIK